MDEMIAQLPHWARVAWAARCGRACVPLLRRHWPAIPAERWHAVIGAIELAEQAAALGTRLTPAKAQALEACVTAGAALPISAVASLAAKPAEFAARAVAAEASGSVMAVQQAYSFAQNVAHEIDAEGMLHALERDLERLVQLSQRHDWTDTTPVPPTVFPSMSYS